MPGLRRSGVPLLTGSPPDAAAVRAAIRAHETRRRGASGEIAARLGYFCVPFRPDEGPLTGCVIKTYCPQPDYAMLARLQHCHTSYLEALARAGVAMPETHFLLLDEDGPAYRPVVVQTALPNELLLRTRMQSADPEAAIELLEYVARVIVRFWAVNVAPDTRIGFHPSLRNFAVLDDQAIFFDSFPPLIHYRRDEMAALLLAFSDSRLIRIGGRIMPERIAAVQDEWYDPAHNLVALVGSVCRLRPELVSRFLDWGSEFAATHMPAQADAIRQALVSPPRLPRYWARMRSLLGLPGAPDLKQR